MPLVLGDYEKLARKGIKDFWAGRSKVLSNDEEKSQGGERSAVLGGKNMDGFLAMIQQLVKRNGLRGAVIHIKGRPDLTLPGYFRPTKLWDVVVLHEGKLVAAIELKSHVGSFGNNFNNRTEEALGTAQDLLTAVRENVLGQQPMPFLGWLILVEDHEKSRRHTTCSARHFPVFDEFLAEVDTPVEQVPEGKRKRKAKPKAPRLVSYLERYNLFCLRLMSEGLYTRAAVVASPREAVRDGAFWDLSDETSLHAFAAGLAGHVATWATASKR
ncbi:MAG: PaeR7I family type II restriction endonuclease [Lysobacteraceae bacterium]